MTARFRFAAGDLRTGVRLRDATPADVAELVELAHRTFVDTYADDTPRATTEDFVRDAFTRDTVAAEVADPATLYLLAEDQHQLLAYAVATPTPLPESVDVVAQVDTPLLLGRLYVDAPAQGRGLGTRLVQTVLSAAVTNDHDIVWLTVWEHNTRAITAYRRWGFLDVGAVPFDLAGEPQLDRVMVRDPATPLTPATGSAGGHPAPGRVPQERLPWLRPPRGFRNRWHGSG